MKCVGFLCSAPPHVIVGATARIITRVSYQPHYQTMPKTTKRVNQSVDKAKPERETRKKAKKEDDLDPKERQDSIASNHVNLEEIQVPKRQDNSKIFVTWNVAGMRSTVKDPLFLGFLTRLEPDVICLQETKLSDKNQVSETIQSLSNYQDIWNHCTARKGYSGTAVFTKEKPISVRFGIQQEEKHNEEGRVITLEYDKYYLVNAYVPNAGEGLRRLQYRIDSWEKDMCQYLCHLQQEKPVIYAGDLNVAHQEIDIYEPKGHEKHAGFTPQERQKFTDLLQCGFVDAFRYLHPHQQSFTYWSKRARAKQRNHGWRLDYFVLSQRLVPCLLQCETFENIYISDHCPLMLHLDLGQLQ